MIRNNVLAVLALLVAGCVGSRTPDPAFDRAAKSNAGGVPEALDIGFDAVDSAAVARGGDTVVAHVVAETSGGVVERYVRFTLAGRLGDFESGTVDLQHSTVWRDSDGIATATNSWAMRTHDDIVTVNLSTDGIVDVTVFDREGTQLAERRVGAEVLMAFATNGAHEKEVYSVGVIPLLQLVLSVPELDTLLMSVAKRPPLWSMLGGIKLTLDWPSESVTAKGDGLFAHDSIIKANGRIALTGGVLRGPNAAPYLLIAGVRRIEAVHPGRSDRRAIVTVTGARRGSGPCLFDAPFGPFPVPDREGRAAVDPTTVEPDVGGFIQRD